MNKIRICYKCSAVDYKKIIKSIKEIDSSVKIDIGCQNMCGIGRNKPFVIVNDIPIIADSTSELIEKIKQAI